ncbi:MAG: hypothetical protein QG621_274 [Patescibacteria group bacterium]|nr:hypothetical protein [Patescibacteria group bacterium]
MVPEAMAGVITVLYYMHMQRIKIEQHTFGGALWFGMWLFTIGYLKLSFWWGVLAVVIWPYLMGAHFAGTNW